MDMCVIQWIFTPCTRSAHHTASAAVAVVVVVVAAEEPQHAAAHLDHVMTHLDHHVMHYIRWNLSNADTLRTISGVHFRCPDFRS